MPTRVVVDEVALRSAIREGLRNTLESLADQVADRARDAAPKNTGAGAASIAGEVVDGEYGYEARISWDQEHFYMLFAELGTSKRSAQPFLRPALDGEYTP